MNNYTTAVWFRTQNNSDGGFGGTLMALGSSGSTLHSATADRALYLDASNELCLGVNPGTPSTICAAGSFADSRWHLAAASLSSAGMKLYADGVLVATNPAVTTGASAAGFWHIGGETLSGFTNISRYDCNDCWLDEAAFWTRALADAEVAQLYRRGANQALYQVRFCTMANCSDAPTWNGPDATANTFFSEYQNMSGTLFAPRAPYLNFPTVAPTLTVNPAANPYVQYRAVLLSDDQTTSCTYAGAPAACSPEISQVQFYRTNYNSSAPGIVNVSSAGQPYYTLASFAATLGSAGCSSGVRYVLSPDGVSYYYYNGSNWVSSNQSAAQSNLQTDLTSGVVSAFATAFPYGTTYIEALLQSSGVSPCALANITMTGTQ